MKDSLGDRIKGQYEDRTRYLLPRRTYTIIRVDGKAFHTLTRGFARPFDDDLCDIMNKTAIALCKGIQGAKLAFVQSDEISVVLTDFDGEQTQAWFDGNIQKMVSISAAIATQAFNKEFSETAVVAAKRDNGASSLKFLTGEYGQLKQALFDSRVFTVPDPVEVVNYLIWRQQDASRNSVQMAARAVFSHGECEEKNINQMQDMLMTKGVNWNDYPVGHKRGRCIVKETYSTPVPHVSDKGVDMTKSSVMRSRWVVAEPPIFTQDRDFIKKQLPKVTEASFGLVSP